MEQIWNPTTYMQHAGFVPSLGARVLEWLVPRAGEHILDLGCGDGQLTAKIAAAGAVVTGIDASAAMVDAAKARGLKVQVCNAERLPFVNEFDAVFSNAALHWIQDQDAMLTGVRQSLKPGGRFVAEMGGLGNIAAIQVALSAVLARHGLAPAPGAMNYFPTPAGYGARLAEHGFAVDEIQLIPRPTPLPASGMRGWLTTFRRGILDTISEDLRPIVVDETVALLEPFLCDEEGQWTTDYVRLRFRAHLPVD